MSQEHDQMPESIRSGDEDSAQNVGTHAGRAWRAYLLPGLLLVVLIVILVSRINSPPLDSGGGKGEDFAKSPTGESVDLEIDFGDGAFRRYSPIPWTEGMTVANALEIVKKHRHGVQYRFRGEGKMAMLYRIDGTDSQGGYSGAKNWVYEVNGERPPVGFAVCPLNASDTVLWKFTLYDYNESEPSAVAE